MKPFHLSSLLFGCLFSATAMAQSHTDCADPLVVANLNPMTIATTTNDNGENELLGTCMGEEISPTWLSWQIDQPGTLTFELTALNEGDDLDFSVFKFNSGFDCNEKTLVRCMAAGETIGGTIGSNAPCLGPTGLNLTETDLQELPGCENGNNNFLKALDCLAGEQYALVVNNFSQTNNGFTIDWGGTATFVNYTATDEAPTAGLSVFPNPTNGFLNISGLTLSGDKRYSLSDSLGRPALSGVLTSESTQLDASQLAAGIYMLKVETELGFKSFKVVVK